MEWVGVHAFAETLGLHAEWLEPGAKLRVSGARTELIFQVDRREVLVDGVRVFMGEGALPTERGESLRISTLDRDRLLVPLLTPGAIEARSPVQIIALDPGHGGRDRGTRNEKLGLVEKDFALDLAQRLRPLLQALGFQVVMTREDDTYIALPERAQRAATAGADLFVSLHFNAAASADVNGIETYVLTPQFQRSTGSDEKRPDDAVAAPGNRFDAWSSFLGYTVHRTLLDRMQRPDRGLKRARFVVLRELPCPGVLVEGGYLSNPEEARLVATDEFRDRLAVALAEAIDAYNQTLLRLRAVREDDASTPSLGTDGGG
jgi:N-acetylmuramoyl-L-alanine amidase